MTPWTVVHQAPLSMGFPKQEYWSGLPIPSPGDLPNSGTEPKPQSPALQTDTFPLIHQGSPVIWGGGSQRQVDQELPLTLLLDRSTWRLKGVQVCYKSLEAAFLASVCSPHPTPSTSWVTNWLPGNQLSSTSSVEPPGSASPPPALESPMDHWGPGEWDT